MTEEEWLTCVVPAPLVAYISPRSTPRKRRLLMGACCRRLERLLLHPTTHAFMLTSERHADREASLDELKRAYWSCEYTDAFAGRQTAPLVAAERAVMGLSHNLDLNHMQSAVDAAVEEAGVQVDEVIDAMLPAAERDRLRDEHTARYEAAAAPEHRAQTDLIRCIFGTPFHPTTIDPTWRTDTVLTLAQTMYDTRDFSAMPILADALQDAGCCDESLLGHCRGGGSHARGCHVVDALLDKA